MSDFMNGSNVKCPTCGRPGYDEDGGVDCECEEIVECDMCACDINLKRDHYTTRYNMNNPYLCEDCAEEWGKLG